MKKTFVLTAIIWVTTLAMATPVTEATARQVALNFWNTYRPKSSSPITTIQRMPFDELHNMYVFTHGDNGFVIVAADDCVRPVLGYSFDSPFPETLHPELNYWLNGYEEQIAIAKNATRTADPRWSSLVDSVVPDTPLTLQNITPLCHTKWDQGSPYNHQCPWDSDRHERAVVGCVATAMAQIMKRWNHPSCGTGSHSYEHHGWGSAQSYGTLSADFEHTTYMWQEMPNVVHVAVGEEAAQALSTLSYHCGVAVEMMYGTSSMGGSAAYSSCGWWASACAEHAFYEFFKYDNSLQFRTRDNYNDSTWLAMIDADLEEGRPLYYAGSDASSGHAFVLDGSNLDTCYHFNWGWSGYGDGYYAMNNLAPGSGGAGGNATYTFNDGQEAIFGIQPIPEVFDTIELYDTICNNYSGYIWQEYTLEPISQDVYLRHLDTVLYLHLHVMQSNIVSFDANKTNFGGVTIDSVYCPIDGIIMPECTFTRNKYRFIGWSRTKNDADSPLYQPGEVVYMSGNITFYARWQDTSASVAMTEGEEVNLWPNPTKDEINFSLKGAERISVSIIDAWGRVVIEGETVANNGKIFLTNLPAGSYTVVARTSDAVYKKQIIKQ